MLIGLFMILLVSRRLLLSMNSNTKPENPDFMRVFGLNFFLWFYSGSKIFRKPHEQRWFSECLFYKNLILKAFLNNLEKSIVYYTQMLL